MSGLDLQEEEPLDVRMRNLILQNAAKAQAQTAQLNQPLQPASTQSPRQKRPNQAQRRQMSAQMSVPVDNRLGQLHNPAGPHSRQHFQHHGNQPHASGRFQPPHVSNGANNQRSSYPGASPASGQQGWRQQSGVQNSGQGHQPGARSNHGNRNFAGQGHSLYNPQATYQPRQDNNLEVQVALLEQLGSQLLANAEIEFAQIEEKERFRLLIEDACRFAIDRHEREVNGRSDFPTMSVQLQCFGSLAAGFATKASDMDLGLLSPFSQPPPDSSESQIPRLVEKVFLEMGLGARLLTKTRVPIIKVCSKPPQKLFADLVEERAKWERGEDDEDLDQEHDGGAAAGRLSGTSTEERQTNYNGLIEEQQPNETSRSISDQVQDKDPSEISLDQLKQGSKSLANYHRAAKKLLHNLGARDLSSSNVSSFTAADYRVLNDLCAAFIRGLASDDLRSRLQRYDSLSFDSNPTMRRTLYGVMAQIEGELVVMACESRSVLENIALQETKLQNRIVHWENLQNGTAHQDPLAFNKELQLASDAIKKFPSVGVLFLEQNQHELASSYHNRATRLLTELGGVDSAHSKILPLILQSYIHGIYDHDVRSQVSAFTKSITGPSLNVIAKKHKTLQLAKEFEKALEQDLYPAESVDDIKQYIELLRSPMEVVTEDGIHFDTAFTMTMDSCALVARMRHLQDPARMSPNQPRDRYRDKLEFPKDSDIGVQCDINFSAQLALHNTYLLRCYAHTDRRVRPLVLFIKHWAKIRGINTPYRGTLSSYGYVLMVLHYLTNVCRPYVCPNLQQMAPPIPPNLTLQQIEATVSCKGRDVRFWRDEEQIEAAVQRGELSHNTDSLGYILRGFFEYYAQNGMMSTYHVRGFDWGRDVLSLRSQSGLLSKTEKGWTGAKTVLEVRGSDKPTATEPALQQANPATDGPTSTLSLPQPLTDGTTSLKPSGNIAKPEVKEVRHRYLFAIEDPFELDHNVARTVTHQGIVAIRDEFRRAWRIIKMAGKDVVQEDLLQEVSTEKKAFSNKSYLDLLDELHSQSRAHGPNVVRVL